MPEHFTSANFSFLVAHDAQLVRLGALAERYFKEDPATLPKSNSDSLVRPWLNWSLQRLGYFTIPRNLKRISSGG
jgi:hypothetical protein